jgi:hypothetical protein
VVKDVAGLVTTFGVVSEEVGAVQEEGVLEVVAEDEGVGITGVEADVANSRLGWILFLGEDMKSEERGGGRGGGG